jgi:uncharacterized protein YfaS (alpha-2-macroglobulin family)
VSQLVLDNGANYLDGWLNAEPGDARDSNLRLDTRAYALYVLAATGHLNLARARALAVRENSLALYGRAYLALAFQRLGVPEDANRLLTNLAGAAKQTTTTAHWEESAARTPSAYLDMDTDARTTALVLQALLARDKNDPLVPKGVRWLMENRRAGHWLSTQETAAVLSTLAAYMTTSGELAGSGAGSVTINGQAWSAPAGKDGATELHKAISDLLINQDNTITITRQDNTGRLYYNMDLLYTRAGAQVTARNEGLSILREYVRPGAGEGQGSDAGAPLSSVAAGDLVEVRLTVIAPTDAYYLMAEDPLPAGLEAVNGTLRTTGLTERLDTRPVATGKDGAPQQAETAAFFDNVEMRDDRTLLFASYLPAGVYEYRYLARATTPGDYAILPASARLTYLPDVWGRSDSGHLTVTEAK